MSQEEKPDDLSIPERILRLQDQWDEIAGLPDAVQLTPAQLAELERRLHDHRLRRRSYKTWEELRSELEAPGVADD